MTKEKIMTNVHKQIIRDLVLTAIAKIESSPKNATNEICWKALGAVGMAAELSAITYFEADAAQKHLNATAAWRGVKNFDYSEKWEERAKEANDEFQRIWS